MENVITAIFTVESEAYKAFTEVRNTPFGPGYTVAEAALVKRENDSVTMIDSFDTTGHTSDDTAAGVLVGSILGILGGPLGILLGAGAGALVGSAFDADDADDSLSALEVTAAKLLEGDVAIIALVQEDEPAFDAALEGYDAIIMRYFAVDVADEVIAGRTWRELAYERTYSVQLPCIDDVLVTGALSSAIWILEWAFTGGVGPVPDIDATVAGLTQLARSLPVKDLVAEAVRAAEAQVASPSLEAPDEEQVDDYGDDEYAADDAGEGDGEDVPEEEEDLDRGPRMSRKII